MFPGPTPTISKQITSSNVTCEEQQQSQRYLAKVVLNIHMDLQTNCKLLVQVLTEIVELFNSSLQSGLSPSGVISKKWSMSVLHSILFL